MLSDIALKQFSKILLKISIFDVFAGLIQQWEKQERNVYPEVVKYQHHVLKITDIMDVFATVLIGCLLASAVSIFELFVRLYVEAA